MPARKRLKKSIKLDRVDPGDFLNMSLIYCCEQCSHYDAEKKICTMGYPSHLHQQKNQLQRFYSNSHMAFCRFTEID